MKVLAAIQINGVDRFAVGTFGSFFTFKNIEVFAGLFGVDFVFEIADWICLKLDVRLQTAIHNE